MEKRAEKNIHRIALIGPESSGKTTLAKQLAQHYDTVWVPEYARDYVVKLQRNYTIDDIVHIAKEQLRMEEEMMHNSNRFLFADTELIVAKVWCEDVFDTLPQWIEEQLRNATYDLYLLTDFDLPWENDPVRENPHRREYFFDWYKRILEEMQLTYAVVSGKGDVRLENAVEVIERAFQ